MKSNSGCGYNVNFKIVKGKPLSPGLSSIEDYQFTFIDFNDVEIVEQINNDKENQIVQLMNGKMSLLQVPKIKSLSSYISCGILAGQQVTKYMEKPSIFRTRNGSLIPQIIVPGLSSYKADNGIGLSGADSVIDGYIWSCTSENKYDSVSSQYYYNGYRDDITKTITTVDAIDENDAQGLRDKFFVISSANSKPFLNTLNGSFAFCYQFSHYNDIDQGDRKGVKPKIVLKIQNESVKKNTLIEIPPTGQVLVNYGIYKANGNISTPSNDIVPPQCVRNSQGQLICKPIFVYPTYNGLVITGQFVKNCNGNGNELFLRLPKRSHFKNNIVVNNVTKTSEIDKIIKAQQQGQLKWFPSLLQQSPNGANIERTKFDIDTTMITSSAGSSSVVDSGSITLSGRYTVRQVKCRGHMAYCPIYFYNEAKFKLFFKGGQTTLASGFQSSPSISPDKNNIQYYFYPTIYINNDRGNDGAGQWGGDNLDKNGAKCIKAEYYSVDKNTKQHIYSVQFDYDTKGSFPRNPIQIFGGALVAYRSSFRFDMDNGNGPLFSSLSSFGVGQVQSNFNLNINGTFDLMTNLSLSLGFDGVTGNVAFDVYPTESGMTNLIHSQFVGQMSLQVQPVQISSYIQDSYNFNKYFPDENKNFFKGYCMQATTQGADNSNGISMQLYGIQKKMQDMKLICCPYWDGDRLSTICKYISTYLNLPLKMINHSASYSTAQDCSQNWVSNKQLIVGNVGMVTSQFRVPRSVEWQKPSVDFKTGTTCYEALQQLSDMTGCVFVPSFDGCGYFYELNNYGVPYLLQNEKETPIQFSLQDILSINLSPSLQNIFNSIATCGYLQKRDNNGRVVENGVTPGFIYTKTQNDNKNGLNFPWAKCQVTVQNGYLTKSELQAVHSNNVIMSLSTIYQGTLTVVGNTRINHLYQPITINGIKFFVIKIDHTINLANKQWQTSYGIQYYDVNKD